MNLFNNRISQIDITNFSRQLATLLGAGVPVIQALNLLEHGASKITMHTMVRQIRVAVEKGKTVADALRKHPRYFNELYCNLINIGENTGKLDGMFERVADYREKMANLKRKIRKALFYPITILVVAVIVTAVMLIFVVPQFASLFAESSKALPWPTQAVINLSQFLQHKLWLLMSFIVVFIFGIKALLQRSAIFANHLSGWLLKIPLIGSILNKAIIARFTRTLNTTFTAGLPLVNALDAVSGATGNRLFAQATVKIRDNVMRGQTLHQSLRQTKLFPSMVVQMVAIGEESGKLDAMLNKITQIFEEDVNHAVDNLGSLLEPLIMVILGVIIGGLVIAMYLPIFNLGNVI